MSEVEKTASPPKRWSAPTRLYLLSICILTASWLAGAIIFFTAGADELTGDLAYGAGWDKHYKFQMERIGGKAAVMADDFSQWFSGLWQGRQLAFTVAILGAILALLCFLLGRGLAATAAYDQAKARDA